MPVEDIEIRPAKNHKTPHPKSIFKALNVQARNTWDDLRQRLRSSLTSLHSIEQYLRELKWAAPDDVAELIKLRVPYLAFKLRPPKPAAKPRPRANGVDINMRDFVLRKHLQTSGDLPFSTTRCKRMENDGRLPTPVRVTERVVACRASEWEIARRRLIGEAA
jgi:hypothetical protein